MVINNAKFEITAVRPEQYPVSGVPEVAFVGRSNVGKSSMINILVNRKSLARVGATPGMTREINFYNIDGKMFFVDLPGYGYASVSKGQKTAWKESIETYLFTRPQLGLVILLVDIRHKPTEDDKTMYDWMQKRGVSYAVLATKVDKISRNDIKKRLLDIKSTLGMGDDGVIIPFSSESRQGKDEVLSIISGVLNPGEGE